MRRGKTRTLGCYEMGRTMNAPALLACVSFLLVQGCSRPLLVVDDSTKSASVEFRNTSSGYLQQFYFADPVECKEPQLIAYSVQPYEAKVHKIPADKMITIWTSAWGLPAKPGYVAWCRPHAFSTNLRAGQTYQITF